uniref:Uncharacterized protein n=1 Tax=Anguilla anguilla TaxID=7936 RepID=A0A0E9U5V1_ANGAN
MDLAVIARGAYFATCCSLE